MTAAAEAHMQEARLAPGLRILTPHRLQYQP